MTRLKALHAVVAVVVVVCVVFLLPPVSATRLFPLYCGSDAYHLNEDTDPTGFADWYATCTWDHSDYNVNNLPWQCGPTNFDESDPGPGRYVDVCTLVCGNPIETYPEQWDGQPDPGYTCCPTSLDLDDCAYSGSSVVCARDYRCNVGISNSTPTPTPSRLCGYPAKEYPEKWSSDPGYVCCPNQSAHDSCFASGSSNVCLSNGCNISATPTVTPTPTTCTGGTFCLNNTIEFKNPDTLSITGPQGQQGYQGTIPSGGLVLSACPFGSGTYSVSSDTVPWTCYTCGNCSCTAPVTNLATVCLGDSIHLTSGSVIRNSTGFVVSPSLTSPVNYTWVLPGVGNYTVNGCDGKIQVVNCTTPTPTPTTVAPTGTSTPTHYAFSITEVGNAGSILFPDISSAVDLDAEQLSNVLETDPSVTWSPLFRHKETDVTKEDFGTQGGGLDNAIFHFHMGHGAKDYIWWGNTYLALSNGQSLHASEVEGGWGKNNKWVYLDSCDILSDQSWGKALSTTHGLFGYTTVAYPSQFEKLEFIELAQGRYGQTGARPLSKAFYHATRNNQPGDVTAAVIFGTEDQYNTDYLPGHGSMAPDKDPSDHSYFYNEWQCGHPDEEVE